MKVMRFLLLAGAVAAVTSAVVIARPGVSRVQGAVGVKPAGAGATNGPVVPEMIGSASEAIAALTTLEARSNVGLVQADIAATHAIHRFGATGTYAAGLSVYRTAFKGVGFCLTFAVATNCTRVPPSASEPLIGMALDPDAERTGEPFVLVSVKARGVRAVTYTCGGTTYPATISADVVTFTAPSSSLRADDCTQNVTLASEKVVSKGV